MTTTLTESTSVALRQSGDRRPLAFDPATLEGLPGPAQRLLTRALPPGVPLYRAVDLEMNGEIKLGTRWLPFTASQILRANVGFVWTPTVGGRILKFVGADVFGPDGASIEFRFHNRIPVVRGSGPDVERSAGGRLAAETVAWIPQALTPQAGAIWQEINDEQATVSVGAGNLGTVDVDVAVDDEGQLLSLGLQRWRENTKPPAFTAFGGSTRTLYTTPEGIAVSGTGEVGWDWGTPQQREGEFFHYTITSARHIV